MGLTPSPGEPAEGTSVWEIVGESGRMLWRGEGDDRNTGEVLLEPWDEPPRPVEQPRLALTERAAVLQTLRAAVRDGEVPETSASDTLGSLAAMLTLVESIETGASVEVANTACGAGARGREQDGRP